MNKYNVLMTGGETSFGLHLVKKMQRQGHCVFIANVGQDLSPLATSGANEYHINFDTAIANGTIEGEVSVLFARAESYFDKCSYGTRIDVLINHAGATHIDWLEDTPGYAFERVMRVNTIAPFYMTRMFVRRIIMNRRDHSLGTDGIAGVQPDEVKYRIINTCSMSTKMGLRASCAYPASKAALELLTRCWAKEFAQRLPISVFGVSPGGIENTGMIDYAIESLQTVRGMTKEQAEKYNQQSPLGRYCTHDEMWAVYNHLINEAPEFATGSIYNLPNAMGL